MEITLASATLYVVNIALENWLWAVLVIICFALPAPYYSLKLIRRNRCLGRNIYSELALADRFMDVWNATSTLASGNQQYHWAFVPNGNSAAAQLGNIDKQLAKWKLVQFVSMAGTFGGSVTSVRSMRNRYLLRNWLVLLLVLWLRVTIFGDRYSHIASGNGRFNEKTLAQD